MYRQIKFTTLIIVIILQIVFIPVQKVYAATQVGLGTTSSFAVLGGSGITNTGSTTITGDVGSFPTTTQTGFGSVTINGTNNLGNVTTQGAKTDLTTAYLDAESRIPTGTITADLGGQTLTPGVYRDNDAPDSLAITGTLTLDAQGDANAVFIFQSGTTLTTAVASTVSLVNGAQACNVYWQVGSSATIGATTTFIGNIFALTSITLNTGATVNGRVLARNGAVTMDTNTITTSTCAAGTLGGASVVSTTVGGSSSSFCPPLNNQVVSPIILESKRIDSDSIYISWGPYSGTNLFNVQYGLENGAWIYNVDVTGFSTTINNLPDNTPIWVRIAARNNCTIGNYGNSKLVGGPRLPNTGNGPVKSNSTLYLGGAISVSLLCLIILLKRHSL